MENKKYWIKDKIDTIAIFLYCFMIFYSMVKSFDYRVLWPDWWSKTWNVSVVLCTAIAMYKIYIYFDTYRVHACICLALIVISTIIKLTSSNDYISLIAATVMFFGTKYKNILKAMVISIGVFLVISCLCALVGIIPNNAQETRGQIKYSLGYIEHNGFMLYFYLMVLGLSLLIKEYRIIFSVVTCVITYILYHITGSVTSTAMIFFFALMVVLYELCKKNRALRSIYDVLLKFLMGLPIYNFLILAAGALYFNIYKRTEVDTTFVARLYWIDKALEESNFPLPQSNFEPTDVKFNLLWGIAGAYNINPGETLYMSLFISWGLLALVPCMIFLLYGSVKAYRKRDYAVLLVILSLAFIGISEAPHLNVASSAFFCVFIAARELPRKRKVRRRNAPRRRQGRRVSYE